MLKKPPKKPTEIGLNDLPSYTDWLDVLLSVDGINQKYQKTREAVEREYGVDKWGRLFDLLSEANSKGCPLIHDADSLASDPDLEIPFFYDGKLFRSSRDQVHRAYLDLITSVIQKHVRPDSHLVDLGAGYGSATLRLALQFGDTLTGVTACEYTSSGLQCLDMLIENHDLDIQTGKCDFNNLDLSSLTIPEGSIFVTSWAMALVKGFPEEALFEIIRHRPRVVIHIEPIREHWVKNTLLEKIWTKYLYVNDYNSSLFSDLLKFEEGGYIRLTDQRPAIFGSNALCPVSIVEWRPV